MRKYSGNIKEVPSPQVENAMRLNYMSEIRKEEFICEYSI
jgi:hypothetical protein